MARHRPHSRPSTSEDDAQSDSTCIISPAVPQPQPELLALVSSRIQPVGRLPETPDERREVFLQLIRLKAQRLSHQECADQFGTSERTIANWVADPLFKEMQQELIGESKQRGHVLISEVIDDALGTMYQIMQHDKSGFVRFKAAEALLNYAGYNMPREESQTDARAGLSAFLDEVKRRQSSPPSSGGTTINVQVNTSSPQNGEESTVVVEAHNPWSQPVLPGGKLPTSLRPGATREEGDA